MTSKRSPFDAFNQDAKKARGAPDPHIGLWKKWDAGGKQPEHLEPLLEAMEPTIQQHAKKVHKGLGGSVPYAAVEAEARVTAKAGLDSYDPKKGAKVRTWVIGNFARMSDFVSKNRNFAQVPKPRFEQFQKFTNAKNEFLTLHGHEPSLEDMKGLLPELPESALKPMMTEFRRELYIGGHPDPEADDGSIGHSPSQLRTILSLMPSLLTAEEKTVFGQLYPPTGGSGSIAQISKSTGMTQNQIYRLRASIFKKVKPHLGSM